MDEKTRIIQADFDPIAPYYDDGWSHNTHYTPYLLRHLPAHCRDICEIGCGTGQLVRTLAARAESVLALDLSPAMIRRAQECSTDMDNIHYVVADVMTYDLPTDQFDCIVSVAALHHMDLEGILTKLRTALAPGGILAVLDLYKSASMTDYLGDVIAVGLELMLRLKYCNRPPQPQEAREVWAERGQHDSYLTLSQIRQISASILPGAAARRHLLWRYSLLWTKPAVGV
jgi:SAM-dependent methyltransferase